MKNYISVNIVSQSLLLGKCIQDNDCYDMKKIEQLKLPYGVTMPISLDFAIQCDWMSDKDSRLSFTDNGHAIINMFDGESIGSDLWRRILYVYIISCNPAWCKRIPYGRREAYLFMNEEEQRCFSEAGLIESQDETVIEWWDLLAEKERSKMDTLLNDVGRKGEKLTMKYEEKRTGIKPVWCSIESNLSGYDILSRKSSSGDEKILIEVKTSSQSLETANAIISRHEWDIAVLKNNYSRYLFYLWVIHGTKKQLAIINVDEMKHHIPDDNELGKWESLNVPFSAFAKFFKTADL